MRPFESKSCTLASLARYLNLQSTSELLFTGITSHSTLVEPGDLFIALPSASNHGANFVEDAKVSGAVAVLTDERGAKLVGEMLPTITVKNPRIRMGDICSWFHSNPFNSLYSVGITGTNGKTTTAELLHQLWNFSGRNTGFIGTTGISIGKEEFPSNFTTPESSELQSIAAAMAERHVSHLVMEVSSHALYQHRVVGSHFRVSAFSNLTQDHLDFHGDMESYFSVKAKLFSSEYSDLGVINIDDVYGRRIFEMNNIPFLTCSRKSVNADWYYERISPINGGYAIGIRGVGGILIESTIQIIGGHNLDNALMAIALAVQSGVDPLEIAFNLPSLRTPAGRFEKVELGQNFLALVDFAHTPDAVSHALSAVREVAIGKVIAVLGCGGDRDSSKRPLMGHALVAGSDLAIMTSDNPRSEDPATILKSMSKGFNESENIIFKLDRRGAIAIAVSAAQAGDVVIILGKGHELGQEINGVMYPFDDRLELARAIEEFS